MKFSTLCRRISAAAAAAAALLGLSSAYPGQPRHVMYIDKYHTKNLPAPPSVTADLTHVILAFANSSMFNPSSGGYSAFQPFMTVAEARSWFSPGTQIGLALGGWGDNAGFDIGCADQSSRAAFAGNVAALVAVHGFDFVDVDWEYPGGNGADYRIVPNELKVDEIAAFPLFLQAVREAIAPRALSIAAPGLERDLLAYTPENSPAIWAAVDMVNIMAYDLVNRRDTVTGHHTSVQGALAVVDRYLSLGLPASKINLGFAFYAKYFQTRSGVDCAAAGLLPLGCPIEVAELPDGSDAGTSGTFTFERANLDPPPPVEAMTPSPDGSCGAGTAYTCAETGQSCCSAYGYCGSSAQHCSAGCQAAFGTCSGPDTAASFRESLVSGVVDEQVGAMWWWDATRGLFWTTDTPGLVAKKFEQIVAARGLGGVMAWSLAEDSGDWALLGAMNEGVRRM